MKWIALVLITGLTTALTITPAHSQGMVIYPAKGQSPEQQNKDKGECHVWAVQQSGFDPAQAQAPTAPPRRGIHPYPCSAAPGFGLWPGR